MKAIWFLILVPVLSAQVVPGKYIVELAGSPAVSVRNRAPVRTAQARMRPSIESLGARVVASLDLVSNAFVVEIPDADAPRLARHPGVARVTPVPLAHASLDHALPLLRVPEAWAAIGGLSNAGAGVKIGIIDSGVSPSHLAFQDSSLTVPLGYPIVNSFLDSAVTSNKIIVARTYVLGSSAVDILGHGTAVAMAAAGGTNTGPLTTITGVAPKAWIGIYKVNDQLSFDGSLLLQALEDAVADGMDVINISAGISTSGRVQGDPFVAAVERAAALGVIVVLAAGNEGPLSTTIDSPASAPSAIAVGASENDRMFAQAMVLVDGSTSYAAQPANGPKPTAAINAPLADVSALDSSGDACGSLPPDSLTGKIALIVRNLRTGPSCFFEDKLNHAQSAGAVAAIVYMNSDSPNTVTMDVRGATLPAVSIDNASGLDIRNRIRATAASGRIQFTSAAVAINAQQVAAFSSRGPNVDLAIKPDVLAVGDNLYLATQNLNPFGALYDASGYLANAPGTSFASPLVAGAAALLKSARPGLTAAQYRSLLVNSAANLGGGLPIQSTGAGVLNVAASVRAGAAVSPVSLSFGAGSGFANLTRSLTVTNLSTTDDTFSISVVPATGVVPALDSTALRLAAGASDTVNLRLGVSDPAVGVSQGYVRLRGSRSDTDTVVPYWYAVSDHTPANIPVLAAPDSGLAGSLQRITFRVIDRNGVPLTNTVPTVKVIGGSGSAQAVSSNDVNFTAAVRLGLGGANIFEIDAGAASVQVIIQSQ
jgi:minor extracellular serine protease Vpr